MEGAQQRLRQVVAQPHQGHRDRGGKVQRAVASAGWLPAADLIGDTVDEQIELFLREPGHRLGVQQSLQRSVRTVRMAARSLLAGAVALKLLIYA